VVLQLLGRNINLAGLIAQRLNKMFRENLEFLFERFECHDLCAIVVSAGGGGPPPPPPL
jgi:cytoplasmic FMR1 interacting protein